VRELLRPKFLLPLVLSISLLGALLGFANVQKLAGFVVVFHAAFIGPIVLLLLAYEGVRAVQWWYLLRQVEVVPPFRVLAFAYALGEITKYSPVGNYVPNYVLTRTRRIDFGLSSAATTFIPLMEVAICLAGLVVLGLGAWTAWLRPLIVFGLLGFFLLLFLVNKLHMHPSAPGWLRRRGQLLQELRNFREGAKDILHPRVLAITAATALIYMLIAGAAFYFVVRGLGLSQLSYGEALAVYFFSLGFSLIVPLPTDIGSIELSGTGALLALGIARHQAVGVMFLNRVFTLGVGLLIAAIAVAVFRDQLAAALSERRGRRNGSAGGAAL
jgi:uncharacterized membrane protein YbhN (UPF0104 family)